MSAKGTYSISEGSVLLNKGLNSTGVRVHAATRDEFLTLSCMYTSAPPCGVNEAANENANTTIRLNVGDRGHEMWIKVVPGELCIQNLPIYDGEEVWVAVTRPEPVMCIQGYASNKPMGV